MKNPFTKVCQYPLGSSGLTAEKNEQSKTKPYEPKGNCPSSEQEMLTSFGNLPWFSPLRDFIHFPYYPGFF